MELWRPVADFEGLYEVSNLGRVRSASGQYAGKIIGMRSDYRGNGYLEVELCKNGKRSRKKVHRLVATAFLPNPGNLPEVNHKDEDTKNNAVDNLEWIDHYGNCMYGTRNARIAEKNSKQVEQMQNGNVVKTWPSVREASRHGYNNSSISLCCRGLATHHKGYQWKYAE